VYLHADAAHPDAGVLAAYAHAAGSDDWQCGAITVAYHPAHHCRLVTPNISLLFFDRPELPALVSLIRVGNPDLVRTLEVTGTHGNDDREHRAAGTLTVHALAAANRTTDLIAYRGDAIAVEPPNKLTSQFDASVAMLARYEACATGCAPCGDACAAIDERHVDLLLRRYAIGFRRRAGGRLRIGNQCLARDMSMTSCPAAPLWVLDGSGELRDGDACIAVGADDQPTTAPCVGGVERRWFVDDEGHILSAAGELRCLTPGAGLVHLEPCSATNNPTWELVPDTQLTARSVVGITATGMCGSATSTAIAWRICARS